MANKYAVKICKQFEGFRPLKYICPAGLPTIGYGHVIRKGEDFSHGINQTEALALLEEDLQIAETAVQRLIRVQLTESQFGALASFTFNLGAARLQSSTLRQCVNIGHTSLVPLQLSRWVYAGGVILDGLVERRLVECETYFLELSDTYDRDIFLDRLKNVSRRLVLENQIANDRQRSVRIAGVQSVKN